jgi:hypothetical protein
VRVDESIEIARPRKRYRVTAAATVVLAEALLERTLRDGARSGCFEPEELFGLPELETNRPQRGLAVNPVRLERDHRIQAESGSQAVWVLQ